MRIALSILMIMTAPAHAMGWGYGGYGGSYCPGGMQPASAAYNGNDERMNLRGQLTRINSEISRKKQELSRIRSKLTTARGQVSTVVRGSAFTAIEQHFTHQAGRANYQPTCPAPPPKAPSGGTPEANVRLYGGGGQVNPNGTVDTNFSPPPPEFCHHGNNQWQYVVEENGRVSERVCDNNVPFTVGAPPPANVTKCRAGLRTYYEYKEKERHLETEIAKLDERKGHYEERLEVINEQIAEGTYVPCATCHRQRQAGFAPATSTNLLGLVVPLLGLGLNFYGQQQQRKMYERLERQRMEYNVRSGWGANGPPTGPPIMPAMFQQRPYVSAPIGGYPNVYQGVYGGAPGAMGPGAFACQNTNPHTMGSPTFSGSDPLYGSPIMANYTNPQRINGLLNPGFGPGFGPGIPGFDPILAQLAGGFAGGGFPGGPNAPATLPLYAQNTAGPWGQHPYFNTPYQYNPNYGPGGYPNYGPGGYPNYGPGGYPYYGPGGYPYYGAGGYPGYGYPGYGYPNYGPGGYPYYGPGGPQYGSPGYGYPYSGNYPSLANANYPGAYGSPISNFYVQIERLKQQIQVIQAGHGGPPVTLPYPAPAYGGTPYATPAIYNTPGGPLNPLPKLQQPNIIRSR